MHAIDVSIFRFINESLGNPVFDRLMPFLSDSPIFTCFFFVLAVFLVCKGGARGRICALVLVLSMFLGNWLIADSIKHAVARARPFDALSGVNLRVGKGGSYSFPSSHAANWFCLTMVFLVYYPRSVWILLPFALGVSFSRVYNGVHYPSDVLAGAVLGAGYTAAIIWMLDALWQWLGPHWFPLWKTQVPSLTNPKSVPVETDDPKIRAAQWLRLGYVWTGALLLARLAYLAAGKIELSEDEAYQWLWSKHLALSYYSKPPLIAYMQFLGTHLWGDTQFGVRFFSPVLAAIMSLLVLRLMTREAGARTAFILLVIMTATPLLSLGAIVMTVDPLSVLFWTAAMLIGWRAASPEGTTKQWMWAGLWMGLGFLSKYTNLFQFVCWAVFFFLWTPARRHLRRPGPWLAVLIVLLCSLPVLVWNSQHNWITVAHVASDGQLGQKTTRNHTLEFLLSEAGVLNPVFFIGAIWAAIGFWRGGRRDSWQLFLFSMGAPLFLLYLTLSFHTRIELNWIAPAVVPMFCLMAVYWAKRWKTYIAILNPLLSLGIGLGIFAVALAHDTQLLNKLLHRQLPARVDLLHRVHGWKETAAIVGQAREQVAAEGKPTFIICEHYGMTSEISFYLPEAKSRVAGDPIVFYQSTPKPDNQFYFWPDYRDHTGQNAIFVRELERPRLRDGWFKLWWNHGNDLYVAETNVIFPGLTPALRQQFESVRDLGVKNVVANGDVVRRLQLFECRNLR